MVRYLLILVINLCSALSLAQGTSTPPDSVKCYNGPELVKIATGLTKGKQYESLYNITLQQSLKKDTIISNDSTLLRNKDLSLVLKDTQIDNRDHQISSLRADLTQTKVIGIVIIGSLLGIILLHQ